MTRDVWRVGFGYQRQHAIRNIIFHKLLTSRIYLQQFFFQIAALINYHVSTNNYSQYTQLLARL